MLKAISKRSVLSITLVLSFLLFVTLIGKALATDAQTGTSGHLLITHNWADDQITDRPSEILLTLYQSKDGVTRDPSNDWEIETDIKLTAPNWSALVDIMDGEGSYYVELQSPISGYSTQNTSLSNVESTGGSDGLIWTQPDSQNPFGSASYFSVLTFGDVSVDSADVESGMAVGGNFTSTYTGPYAIGLPGTANPDSEWRVPKYTSQVGYPVAPHNPRFLLKGNLNAPNGFRAYGGSMVVSDSSTITVGSAVDIFGWYSYKGTDPNFLYDSSTSKSNFQWHPVTSTGNYADVRGDATKIGNFFSAAESSLKALSQQYANMQTGGNIFVFNKTMSIYDLTDDLNPGNIPAGVDTVVCNLTVGYGYGSGSNNQGGMSVPNVIIPSGYTGKFIINVLPGNANSGGGKVTSFRFDTRFTNVNKEYQSGGGNAKLFEVARKYADQIIWNFPDPSVTTIDAYNYVFIGSVLAPYSHYKATSSSVNGALIAKSLQQTSSWEAHSTITFGRTPQTQGYSLSLSLTSTKEQTGSLTVKKIFSSSSDSRAVEFTVDGLGLHDLQGVGLHITGSGYHIFSSNQFTLTDGAEITISGLHLGDYSVSETIPPGFDEPNVTVNGNAASNGTTVTLTDSDPSCEFSFTNKKTSEPPDESITIIKTYRNPSDNEKATFTLTRDDGSAVDLSNGLLVTSGAALISNGQYGQFELEHGEEITISKLPIGTYAVTETVTGEFDEPSVTIDGSQSSNGTEVTLTSEKTNFTYGFVNAKPIVPPAGSLTIIKTYADPSDSQKATFTLTSNGLAVNLSNNTLSINDIGLITDSQRGQFQLDHGEEVTISGLPLGDYSVSETVPTGFDDPDVTVNGTVASNGATVTLTDSNPSGEISFTNNKAYEPPNESLTIIKTYSNPSDSKKVTFTLTKNGSAVDLSDNTLVINNTKLITNDLGGQFQLAHDERITISGLPTGQYAVMETVPEGFNAPSVTIDGGQASNGETVELTLNKKSCTYSFVNAKSNDPSVDVTLEAVKSVTGAVLTADQFTFLLKDETGAIIGTAKNDANGRIVFPSLHLTTAKDYIYTMSEESGSEAGYTYDSNTYEVTIKVTQNATDLQAVTVYPSGGVEFKNYYDDDDDDDNDNNDNNNNDNNNNNNNDEDNNNGNNDNDDDDSNGGNNDNDDDDSNGGNNDNDDDDSNGNNNNNNGNNNGNNNNGNNNSRSRNNGSEDNGGSGDNNEAALNPESNTDTEQAAYEMPEQNDLLDEPSVLQEPLEETGILPQELLEEESLVVNPPEITDVPALSNVDPSRIVRSDNIPAGYTVVHYEGDYYIIYDDEGVPLGYLIIPEGMSIDDFEILDEMIPFGAPVFEMDSASEMKNNPKTSDDRQGTAVQMISLAIAVVGFMVVFTTITCVFIRLRKHSR